MNKIEIELFIVAIFALFALIAMPSVSAVPCNCGDICVNETGWWCDGGAFHPSGTPIQAAIDNATAGETICVKDGTYNENVDVNTPLTIQSENGADYTTVQAASSSDHVFKVTADYVTISGFSVTGAHGSWNAAGIYLNDSADHCNISANAATNNEYGIGLSFSSDNELTGNAATNNGYGIDLYASSNNEFTGNTVSNNDWHGIRLSSSSNNEFTGNTVSSNEYGIYLYSVWWAPSGNNLIYNNYFDNTNNAFDNGNNVWNITKTAGSNIIGGSWLGGNYWSDYDGFDANGDGLGDTLLPYNSNGNIISGGDWHPLVPAGIAPILSIEKSDNPDHVLPGDTINYSIILTNTGYINATNVTVTETYDVNVTFVSAVPAPYEGNDTWIFPSLDVSATKRINISVTVNPSIPMGTYLHNIIKVTCDEGVTDSDTDDTIVSSEYNCTCGDICVNTTGWWCDGGAFYPSDTPIQDAIDNASAGDTICVKDGEYKENVDVDKRLTLKSENGAASTIVQALNSRGHVFEVTADYVNISGFTVKGADHREAGMFLVGVAHCNISDNIANSNNGSGFHLRQSSNNILAGNTASNNDRGIVLEGSNSNTLIGNTANSNSGDGIRLGFNSDSNTFIGNTANSNYECGILLDSSSNYNTLSGNTANWNYECGILLYSSCNTLSDNTANSNYKSGILLYSSCNNSLRANTASNNVYGIRLYGTYQCLSSSNTLTNNTASNNVYGILLYLANTNTISSNTANSNNYGGILLYSSCINTVTNNTANSNNYGGILLDFTKGNTLTGNTVSNNYYGILLSHSSNNTLTSNTASSNDCGIYLRSSSNYNTLTSNTASNNCWDGIRLSSSSNNTLTSNTASNDNNGISLESSSNYNTLTSNTASGNSIYGIQLHSSSNNTFTCNNVSNNTLSDFWSSHDSHGNVVTDLTIANYPTTISFTYDDVGLKGVDTAPSDPEGKVNISKYVNVTGLTANSWIFMNVSYEEGDLGGVDEDSLRMWRYDDGVWTEVSAPNGVNNVENYVYANITVFSIFAPLGNPSGVLKPDLVITEKWLCWPDNCTICYNVMNIGDGTAPACHNTALYIDGVAVAHDHVTVPLAPGESYIGCFNGYVWTYTPPSDEITVCADNDETLDEFDEDNNCLANIWMCGDVNCDGKVTMSDVRKVFNRYLDPNYPLDLPWAADVNCGGKVTMSDVRKVFNRYLDPGYELNCCCEV